MGSNDRWEPELNTAIPGEELDTTTPYAMAQTLHHLLLGNGLSEKEKTKLQNWMKGNTTGDRRIRAGVPEKWTVADKTGSGEYGTTNDIGVVWPVSGSPLVMAIFFTQSEKEAKPNDAVIKEVTKILIKELQ